MGFSFHVTHANTFCSLSSGELENESFGGGGSIQLCMQNTERSWLK